jgi:hypothetical protein
MKTQKYVVEESIIEAIESDMIANPEFAKGIAKLMRETRYVDVEPQLPINPNHDGSSNSGFKRIYRWLGWELSYPNYSHNPHSTELYSITKKAILFEDPSTRFHEEEMRRW